MVMDLVPTDNIYTCAECGKELKAERKPCPNCGSTKRHVYVTVSDVIKLRSKVKVTVKDSSGKIKKIVHSGQKLSKYGKEAKEELIIDIEGDRKFHHVEELNEDGEWDVVHHHDEKLKK